MTMFLSTILEVNPSANIELVTFQCQKIILQKCSKTSVRPKIVLLGNEINNAITP